MHILIIIPTAVSYFYELIGHRLRDALQSSDSWVTLEHLESFAVREYDWCFFVNIAEIIQGFIRTRRGGLDDAVARITVVHNHARQCAHVLSECVTTQWYAENMRWCDGLRIDHRIDMGYHPQSVAGNYGYHFLFNGLTGEEQRHVHNLSIQTEERPIPWVFIGTHSKVRANIANRLVEGLDSRGFLYLRNPQGQAVGWTGPHLNYEQYLQVHRRARFSVWCAHHDDFYVESERFRMAALTGAVPVKILMQPIPHYLDIPFQFLMLDVTSFEASLCALDYEATWYCFRETCLRLQLLEESLRAVMKEISTDG